MEGIHERFLVTIQSDNMNREFEVVPNIGHYAILENEVTVAQITIDEDGKAQVSESDLQQGEIDQLMQKIHNHMNTGLTS